MFHPLGSCCTAVEEIRRRHLNRIVVRFHLPLSAQNASSPHLLYVAVTGKVRPRLGQTIFKIFNMNFLPCGTFFVLVASTCVVFCFSWFRSVWQLSPCRPAAPLWGWRFFHWNLRVKRTRFFFFGDEKIGQGWITMKWQHLIRFQKLREICCLGLNVEKCLN